MKCKHDVWTKKMELKWIVFLLVSFFQFCFESVRLYSLGPSVVPWRLKYIKYFSCYHHTKKGMVTQQYLQALTQGSCNKTVLKWRTVFNLLNIVFSPCPSKVTIMHITTSWFSPVFFLYFPSFRRYSLLSKGSIFKKNPEFLWWHRTELLGWLH